MFTRQIQLVYSGQVLRVPIFTTRVQHELVRFENSSTLQSYAQIARKFIRNYSF